MTEPSIPQPPGPPPPPPAGTGVAPPAAPVDAPPTAPFGAPTPSPFPYGPPPGGPGPRPSSGDTEVASTLVGSTITLVLGAVVALVLFVVGDVPSDYFGNASFQSLAATLAAVAAPVALLLSWDEFDLSIVGTVSLGSYLFVELSDDSVVPALVVVGIVGLASGAAIGVVRWLTGAHSALVSLGGGILLSGVAVMNMPPEGIRSESRIDGQALAIVSTIAVVGLTVAVALLMHTSRPAGPSAATPGPRVVAGFAVSGLAGTLFGAFLVGSQGFFTLGLDSFVLVLVFTTVAVAGAVRDSGVIAPLAVVPAALIVMIINDSVRLFSDWDKRVDQVVLGCLFVACVAIANGLRRALARG